MVRELLDAFADPGTRRAGKVERARGGQAYSDARRDMVHPAGPDGIQPYVELGLTGVFGNVGLVSRPAIETGLPDDPDWPGRKDLDVTGRMVEAYITAQFKWVSAYFGQMDQHWGPPGRPRRAAQRFGYGRPAFAIEVGNRQLKLLGKLLSSAMSRYPRPGHQALLLRHRLSSQLTQRLNLALWETTVLSGLIAPSMTGSAIRHAAAARQPVRLGDDGNVIVGFDLQWRFLQRTTSPSRSRSTTSSTRIGVGRIARPTATPLPSPPLAALPERRWRALYTQASSLAFRSSDPFENFTDAGVGIGRNFADDDQLFVLSPRPPSPDTGW
jgi:hypothetical protein